MPTHPLAAVVKRRDRVLAEMAPYAAAPIDGAAVSRMAEAVVAVLPDKCRYDAVYRSLTALAVPTPPTRDELRRVAGALAGDTAGLKAGRPVYPVTLPAGPAKVVLQFLAAEPVPPTDAAPDPRVRYRARIVTGPGCPSDIEVVWPVRFVRFLAARPDGLGFARPPRPGRPPAGRPFQHPDTLVGMLVRATVAPDPAADKGARTKVDGLRCPPGLRAFNRALTEMRFRAGFACPFAYADPCHRCPKGQAECPAAVRPLTLVAQFCPRCRAPDALFDPAWKRPVCTRCAAAKRQG